MKIVSFLILFLFSLSTLAQEVKVSVLTQESWPPGKNVPVTVSITKGSLRGFARFYHDLPLGFIIENVYSSGADFFRDNNQVNYVWLDLPEQDIITIQYLARADELLAGSFTITGRFDYLVGGKRRVSVLSESASIKLDRSASVESVELLQEEDPDPRVVKNDSVVEHKDIIQVQEVAVESISEISFRVQVSISSQRISQPELEDRIGSKLKYGIRILKSGNMFKYQSGSFKTYSEAAIYLEELKHNGVEDSFIVAFNNGNQISINEARELSER